MIVLYSYPELFGVADNNGYGLKVFAFMRLAGICERKFFLRVSCRKSDDGADYHE